MCSLWKPQIYSSWLKTICNLCFMCLFFPVLILIAYFFISASWMQHFRFSLSAIFHMHPTEKCSVLSEMSCRINSKENNKKNPPKNQKNFVCCPSLRFCRETASSVFVYCFSLSALPKDKHSLRLCDKISVKWRVKMTVCVYPLFILVKSTATSL